jgi:hypothetical protein
MKCLTFLCVLYLIRSTAFSNRITQLTRVHHYQTLHHLKARAKLEPNTKGLVTALGAIEAPETGMESS